MNMNKKEENICKLCFKTLENDFILIDERMRTMIDYLLLRVNLDVTEDAIICNICADIIEKSFCFKSDCKYTENLISSYAKDKETQVELKEVLYKHEKVECICEDFIVCRFCLAPTERGRSIPIKSLSDEATLGEMLLIYMPELNFNLTENPMTCTACREKLKHYLQFITDTMNVQGMVSVYCKKEESNTIDLVKLNDIPRLSFANSSGYRDKVQMPVIKQESGLIEEDFQESKETEEIFSIKTEDLDLDESCKVEEANEEEVHSDVNTEPANYKCSICSYVGRTKGILKKHTFIHLHPSEIKMYECEICHFKTRHHKCLKMHMLTHKGPSEVDMFKCEFCAFKTKYKSSFRKHVLRHKDATEVDIYKCATCPYETKRKDHIQRHMLTHKDASEVPVYKCKTCSFTTRYKRNLANHLIIHKDISEVKMYKCDRCAYKTKYKSHLKPHALVHKDVATVEMYKCELCSYRTKQKSNLQKHALTHKDDSKFVTFHF